MFKCYDAITTVGFALQSYVNTCIHEDTEENRAERDGTKHSMVNNKKTFRGEMYNDICKIYNRLMVVMNTLTTHGLKIMV